MVSDGERLPDAAGDEFRAPTGNAVLSSEFFLVSARATRIDAPVLSRSAANGLATGWGSRFPSRIESGECSYVNFRSPQGYSKRKATTRATAAR